MEGAAPAASRGNTPSFTIEENAEYVDLSHKPHPHLGEGYTVPPTAKVPPTTTVYYIICMQA
jgi:hypothetical protein